MWKRDVSPKPADVTPVQPTLVPTPTTPSIAKPLDSVVKRVEASLGRSMTIKGDVTASEDLTLLGQMNGHVTLPDHTLTIGPDADIRAEISAGAVVIMGAVVGNVTATKRVEIRATGSVTGDISSPGLAIDDGGVVIGKIQMTGRKQEPRRSAVAS